MLLGGCASAEKRQYLRHLSLTIDPVAISDRPFARARSRGDTAVADAGAARPAD